MTELITSDLVVLDAHFEGDKDDVIRALVQLVADSGRSANPAGLADDAFAREAKTATGMPGGLAIPHCRSEHVTESTLAFARLSPSVDFGAKDRADLVFLIAAPASGDQEHMKLLTKLARALVRPEFTAALRSATTREEVVALVSDVVSPPVEAAAPAPAIPTSATSAGGTATAASDVTPTTGPVGAMPPPRRLETRDPAPLVVRRTSKSPSLRSPPARRASPTPTWPPRH